VPSGTIVGGEAVVFSLHPSEIPTARDALAALSQGFTTGHVLHSPGALPSPGDLNVYNFTGGKPPFTLPTNAQGVVLIGHKPQKITGHSGTEALIGNQGPDTIVAGGGHGTIIAGDGGNLIKAGAGPFQILTGVGRDTVNLTGGADTFTSLGGHDTIHLKNTQLTARGAVNIIGKGADTITILGNKLDKITMAGSATVTGTRLIFDASGAGNHSESVTAVSSGTASMLGSHGTNVFESDHGRSTMVAGSNSHDTFAGGTGDSFMDADKAASVLFRFDSSLAGGFHTIGHFAHGKDSIDLQGYTQADIRARLQGANTIINIDHDTRIVLKGYHLQNGDITFT
jgi:hypothetical protein